MIHDIETDTRYLEEDLAFASNTYVKAWSTTENRFVPRMASQLAIGFTARMGIKDFMSMIHAFANARPQDCLTFLVSLDALADTALISFSVIDMQYAALAPVQADNAGFFEFALQWSAHNGAQEISVSVTGPNLFWIHCQ
ncbi:hypothetical protein [Pseudomonas pohangensis]|uniref:hypothetical protein n=1 Tax=Pseudomonas pohangensis TaxID=364197 RepID=UPI000B7F31D5|nr:hypothetical protein [Pseudomonas pohangensis]